MHSILMPLEELYQKYLTSRSVCCSKFKKECMFSPAGALLSLRAFAFHSGVSVNLHKKKKFYKYNGTIFNTIKTLDTKT